MSVSVAIHEPTTARVVDFESGGEPKACLILSDAKGRSVDVYVDPAIAHAIADAFNAARAGLVAEAEAAS
jgi:hypothetical protein